MDTLAADLFILALAWLAYFLAHSFLASLAAKRWIAAHHPAWMPRYRLAYNAFATVSALPVAWLFYRNPGPMLWEWTGWQAWIANGLALAAVAAFFVSLRHYDADEFLGLRQLRDGAVAIEDQEAFRLSPFHRFVRHPWYFFASFEFRVGYAVVRPAIRGGRRAPIIAPAGAGQGRAASLLQTGAANP